MNRRSFSDEELTILTALRTTNFYKALLTTTNTVYQALLADKMTYEDYLRSSGVTVMLETPDDMLRIVKDFQKTFSENKQTFKTEIDYYTSRNVRKKLIKMVEFIFEGCSLQLTGFNRLSSTKKAIYAMYILSSYMYAKMNT